MSVCLEIQEKNYKPPKSGFLVKAGMSDSKIVKRDQAGKVVEGSRGLNPTGKGGATTGKAKALAKRTSVATYLRGLLGDNGAAAFDVVLAIAQDRLPGGRLGRNQEVSVDQRLEAARLLLQYAVGKPVETVNLNVEDSGNTKVVVMPENLTTAELEALESIHRKIQQKDIVDAEVVNEEIGEESEE